MGEDSYAVSDYIFRGDSIIYFAVYAANASGIHHVFFRESEKPETYAFECSSFCAWFYADIHVNGSICRNNRKFADSPRITR